MSLGKRLTDYTEVNTEGTLFLRSLVSSQIYSGNAYLQDKLASYQLYWKFYKNLHWAKNNDYLLSFNYVKAIINKINEFTVGKDGFMINIEDTYGEEIDEQFETAYEALLLYNWKENKKNVLTSEILQMGSICGDGYILCIPEPEKQRVKIRLLDTRTTVPIFNNGDKNDVLGYRYIVVLTENANDYVQRVTEYYDNRTVTYYKKDTDETSERYEENTEEHNLGFVPIIHIENSPMSDGYGGFSDAHDILKINKIYNEMAEDVRRIIDYYTQPVTVVTGATVGNLKRGIGQIWSGLPAEASVSTLGLGENLTENNKFMEMMKQAMHDLTGVPEEVLSKVQHISNTSAAALKMMYHALIMASDKKALMYGAGFEEVHRMVTMMFIRSMPTHPLVVKMMKRAAVIDLDFSNFFYRYKAVPVFIYGLPHDRMVMLQEAQLERTMMLGSRREIMERLGKKNIPKIMKEIEDDKDGADVSKDKEIKLGISKDNLLKNAQ